MKTLDELKVKLMEERDGLENEARQKYAAVLVAEEHLKELRAGMHVTHGRIGQINQTLAQIEGQA